MQLYFKHPHEETNVNLFKGFMRANPDVTFYHPNVDVAPWHVQARIGDVLLNFWPHKMKGQINKCRSRTGYGGLQQLIDEAKMEDDFHVID